jgi:recombinational DNA repair protein (RecF pathway)
MYAIHTTPGFIIDSRPRGEAGKLLYIFTRELGLVLASAQGIRLEKSKLRYHAREYSFGTFSFVRGREFWRLTSAAENGEGGMHLKNQAAGELIARIAFLLKRFLHGEESHPELFDLIAATANFLNKRETYTDDQLKTLESITVLRILHALGYIGDVGEPESIIREQNISAEFLDQLGSHRVEINRHINKALKESQL